jgi:photosystem II stability/assembly factor-like uncharacterized protein
MSPSPTAWPSRPTAARPRPPENGLPARGKYTQAIKVDRTRAGRVLAACEIGIYLTEDGAQNWRQVLPTKETVNDVQQSPHDPKLWLAITQSAGAWISRDGGVTWRTSPACPSDRALYNVTFDVTNPQRFAIGSWAQGVLTSEDGGKTWTDRNAGLPDGHCVWRVGVDPEGRLYASVVGKRSMSPTISAAPGKRTRSPARS